MADYYAPTVVQPTIPNADMTPLELLLLSNIFDAEPDGDGWYFSAYERPADMIWLSRIELESALAESSNFESKANTHIEKYLADSPEGEVEIELDLSITSWEFIFQSIVRRSATLTYITAVTSFTCSKMRPDGFGGMAVLITADVIKGKAPRIFFTISWTRLNMVRSEPLQVLASIFCCASKKRKSGKRFLVSLKPIQI